MLSYRDCNTLYAAPGGSGNGKTFRTDIPGCGPLGSIQAALERIEQMRGSGMLQPITIRLLPGEYLLTSPIQFRPTMSNVTVEPFGPGEVTLSGGRRITGFFRSEWNGHPCFAAHIPDVESGAWKFTDLYVDGLRADHTRLPLEGYYTMKETELPSTELFASSRYFLAETADAEFFASLHAFEDCIVSFNHYWIDEHTPVRELDPATGKITMEYRTRFNIRPGQEYILENAAEAFHRPNEWYLDRAKGMLYYLPRSAEQTPESIQVWAPCASQLITISGSREDAVTGIHFRDLTFAYTRGDYGSRQGVGGESTDCCASDAQAVSNADGVISLRYAHGVSFTNCSLHNYGLHGFNLQQGCRAVSIEGCTLYDGGAGGIRVCGGAYGADERDITRGCTISDCTITHVGQRYLSACGILIMHAAEMNVLHNEIGDLYYTGISCGWTWGYARTICRDNRIIGNHIYDLGKGLLSDMGGVYLLGSQPGTVVANNRIHDIKCKEYGGWALYTDEGSAGMLLENNLCYRTSSNSYHQHYGTSNVVRNNIFADAGEPLLRVSRPEAHLSIMFTENIVLSTGTPILADYAQGANGAYCLEDGAIVSGRNLLWCTGGELHYTPRADMTTLAQAQEKGMERESIQADPLFADPANDDYTLAENSPAFALGFRPFDWKSCGPRK